MQHLPPMSLPSKEENHKIIPFAYYNTEPRNLIVGPKHYILRDNISIISRTNADGFITHANQAFVVTSGYSKEELIGSSQNIIRHPDMPRSVFKNLWETISQGKIWEGHLKNLRKDGGYYWVHATIQPVMENGKPKSYTSTRRKMDRETIQMAEALYAEMRKSEKEQVQ